MSTPKRNRRCRMVRLLWPRPVEAVGRAHASASTALSRQSNGSTSGFPVVTGDLMQQDTYPRADYWPVRQR